MELETVVYPPIPTKVIKESRGVETLAAGDLLKVEIGAEQELNVQCPVGKVWLATVTVHIVETDA